MEAVGLAISVISLAGTFKDCIDLFSMISTAKSMGKDFTVLSIKLDIEKTLFLQWAKHVRLIHTDYDPRLDEEDRKSMIARILESIKVLLSDGSELEHRYGMQRLRIEQRERFPILSAHRLEQFRSDFGKLKLNHRQSAESAQGSHQSLAASPREAEVSTKPQPHKQNATLKEQFCWAVRDKEKFGILIQQLSDLVRGLEKIVPLDQSASAELLEQDVKRVGRISRLELLMDGAKNRNRDDSLPTIIQAQIDQRCQQRILDSLWYRMIDHRRNSVLEAHPGTFDWALHPLTDDVEWDDLCQWLQSGSEIYWLYGKPGSGKTTLMKYLYDNSLTHSLLSKWAKDEPLSMPQFFFWDLGTAEQKTQYGLYRGLLYNILKDNPSLIQNLLPEMWREAHKDCEIETQVSMGTRMSKLEPPTEEEMMHAFPKLKVYSQAAFCFFIDGLDEYSGDPFQLIKFLNKLVSSNIKAIVSSREIDSCVQAFSQGPKLRLQDLTRNDIERYVHDTIVLHPSTEAIDNVMVDNIQEQLTRKAHGVFLWVILACRSIIQGFAASDRPEELQQRLDELPPELDDLFRHILRRINSRYYEQAAKLISLCFHSTDLRINYDNPHHRLFTLGLALAEADKLDTTNPLNHNNFSDKERISKCQVLERRLRSRCCGLLEIRLGNFGRCFCQSHLSLSTEGSHRRIVDSTVEFIHRTVFEFLKTPGIWDSDYLQIRDRKFHPTAILSRVNTHLMLASMLRIRDDLKDGGYRGISKQIFDSLLHLRKMDSERKDGCTGNRRQALPRALSEIADILKQLASREDMSGPAIRGLVDYIKLHFRTSKNGCPDLVAKLVCELDIQTMIRNIDVTEFGNQSSPLLHHAIGRPLLQCVSPSGYIWFPCSRLIIKELVARGCDVNEVFVEFLRETATTPWLHWLGQPAPRDYETALGNSWLAEDLLSAGADVSGAVIKFRKPITILVGRKIMGNSLKEASIDKEDGGFSVSHPFFEDDLDAGESLRISYERVRSLLRDRVAKTGLKRRRAEMIQDEENIRSSGVRVHQSKRQHSC